MGSLGIALALVLGGTALAKPKNAPQSTAAKAVAEGCYVWNPSACTAEHQQADRKLILEVTKDRSRTQAARELTAFAWDLMLRGNSPQLALSRFNQALILEERQGEAWYGAATALAVMGVYDPAEKLFRRAVALEPKNARYHFNLGRFLSNARRDFPQAETYFRKAMELDPKFPDPYTEMGLIALERKKKADAKEWAEKAKAHGGRLPRELSSLLTP